eukprot:scaffold87057_cov24-Tisochrysis_lutea.AAC.5
MGRRLPQILAAHPASLVAPLHALSPPWPSRLLVQPPPRQLLPSLALRRLPLDPPHGLSRPPLPPPLPRLERGARPSRPELLSPREWLARSQARRVQSAHDMLQHVPPQAAGCAPPRAPLPRVPPSRVHLAAEMPGVPPHPRPPSTVSEHSLHHYRCSFPLMPPRLLLPRPG